MHYEFKAGDRVNFKKITKGAHSCKVYNSSGVIQKIDSERNAYVIEENDALKGDIYMVPLINLEIIESRQGVKI